MEKSSKDKYPNDPNYQNFKTKKKIVNGKIIKMVEVPPIESLNTIRVDKDGHKSKKDN